MKIELRQALWSGAGISFLATIVTYWSAPDLTILFFSLTFGLATFASAYSLWGFRGGLVWLVTIFSFGFGLATSTIFAQMITPSGSIFTWKNVIATSPIGLGLVAITTTAVWILAAETHRRPPSKNIAEAIKRFFKRRASTFALWQVVDGKLAQTRQADQNSTEAPHVIIPKDYAIVFENNAGKFTHAEFGPKEVSVQPTDALEKCIVIFTRPRFKRLSIQQPITKDGIAIDRFDFAIFYQLKTDPHQYRTENNQYPIAQDTLTQAVYAFTFGEDEQHHAINTWEGALQEAAKNYFHSELANVKLLDLFGNNDNTSPVRQIACLVQVRLNKLVEQWGCVVTGLEVTHITLPQNLRNKLEDKWFAERSIEIKSNEGKAEGNKIKEIEQAKTTAWKETLKTMSEPFHETANPQILATQYIQILQYLDSLVQMSKSSSSTMIASPQELQALMHNFEETWAKMALTQPQPSPSERDFKEENKKPHIVGGEDNSISNDHNTNSVSVGETNTNQ